MSGEAVIVDRGVLEGEPVRAVSYLEPEHEWDSGFAVFTQPPDEAEDSDSDIVCMNCLQDEQPELALVFAIARKRGEWNSLLTRSLRPREPRCSQG